MEVRIDVPEDVFEGLKKEFGDLSRHALESLAIDGYRRGAIGESQVRRMLDFTTRIEANEFLCRAGLYYQYTREEMEREVETNRRAVEKRDQELARTRAG